MSRRKPRKAVSPVAAAAFFLAATLIVFNALVLISDQALSDFSSNLRGAEWDYERKMERLSVFRITVANEKLNLSITNRGPVTSQLVSLWMSEWNRTTANWHRSRPLNIFIEPGRTVTDIGQDFSDTLDPRLTYALRVVTARGNVFAATYSALGGNVLPGFVNTGFLTISFDPSSFLYTPEGSCSAVPAWDVPASASEIVWSIYVINHGTQHIKLYKWSAMSFVKIPSTGSAFNQEAFFMVGGENVGDDACDPIVGPPDTVPAYNFDSDPYIIPRQPENDTQTGGDATRVWFATSTPGGGTTQTGSWASGDEYMIFIIFYFLYGTNEQYVQVIPFAGVHFT